MGWKEAYEDGVFKIKTGDGRYYSPSWASGEKEKEYNHTIFDFIDAERSYVGRNKPKSAFYNLEFYFQGENHIQESEEFEFSADDPRVWEVQHPVYGTIYGHPISLKRNNTSLNITAINVQFWETLTDKTGIKPKVSPLEVTAAGFDEYNEVSLDGFTEIDSIDGYVPITNADKLDLLDVLDSINLSYKSFLDNEMYQDFLQTYYKVVSSFDNIFDDIELFFRDVNELLMLPNRLALSIDIRSGLIKRIFENVKTLAGSEKKASKKMFEVMGGAAVISAITSSINVTSEDFFTRLEVMQSSDELNELVSDYLLTVDSFQTQSPIPKLNYSIDSDALNIVLKLAPVALMQLSALSYQAKQERTIILEKDSNLIVLTHRYFGLDPEDKNLERFRKLNNIKNRKLINIKKGSQIKYFV